MLKKLNRSALILSSAMALSVPTMAYEAGDILLRVGTATVTPESKSDDLKGIAGEAVTANDNTQIGISGTYMITNNIGVEVLGATPFSHDIKATGGTLNGTPIAEVKHLPPTVSAQYYFMDSTSALQPYVGAGINVTVFFDENLTTEMKGAGYEKVSLDSSAGLAVQAGIDYNFNEKMFVNASAMYAQIGTTATIDDTTGNDGAFGSQVVVDYDLDPMVYRVNFGYKF